MSNDPESATVETAAWTAAIIQFPTREKPPLTAPEERLVRAMESLKVALAQQRDAVAGWRDVLEELKVTTGRLNDSVERYRVNMRTLAGAVSSLHAKSRALEEFAGGVAATSTTTSH